MSKFKAIIFDMDGVLFDTETFYYDRRKKFLADRGIGIEHLPYSFFIGGNMKQVWQAVLRDDYNKWDIEQLQKDYNTYKTEHPLPYKELMFEDTADVVKQLKVQGYKIAVASSSNLADIHRALTETDLINFFDIILSGEQFEESKPYPAIYQQALKLLEVANDEALIIEDSEKGIQAGVSADVEVWAIEDHKFGMNQKKASRMLSSLRQVLTDI
ncbi:HAD family phosphatase [uncultured Streptococcus sp.]|uniref:HAD family hydrolase n=1 Tax=uncultured Streptococcus sp. TaxID=83427 RepID=UPI0027DD50D4|nr:HAD family phosphatase [uncultured Streptococcus sp.]